jgi:hypothetical protein
VTLPQVSPRSSGVSNLAPRTSGFVQPVSSLNLNWPDVAALAMIIGGIMALLLRSQRSRARRENGRYSG